MKKFVKELITNRFGIVLATLNVCYFGLKNFGYSPSKHFLSHVFEHAHGENCIFIHHPMLFPLAYPALSETIMLLNLPALLFSLIPGKIMLMIFPQFCFFTQVKFQMIFFVLAVVLQWLFIAWLSRKIALKLAK